jgi:azurin
MTRIVGIGFARTRCAAHGFGVMKFPLLTLFLFAFAGLTAAQAKPRVIEIVASDAMNQMKYNVTKLEAKAGEEITVVLTNAGTLPKEAMGHNWVLLKAGTDAAAFANAAAVARDTDYIPPSMKDRVIASVPVLGPRKSGQVTFKAPAAGEYVFLCSFPAHFASGMKGTLVVK